MKTAHMKKHLQSVHEENTIQCNICDSKFSAPRNLKVHISVVHDGKKPFKCDLCDKCYAMPSKLKQHILRVHEGKKS